MPNDLSMDFGEAAGATRQGILETIGVPTDRQQIRQRFEQIRSERLQQTQIPEPPQQQIPQEIPQEQIQPEAPVVPEMPLDEFRHNLGTMKNINEKMNFINRVPVPQEKRQQYVRAIVGSIAGKSIESFEEYEMIKNLLAQSETPNLEASELLDEFEIIADIQIPFLKKIREFKTEKDIVPIMLLEQAMQEEGLRIARREFSGPDMSSDLAKKIEFLKAEKTQNLSRFLIAETDSAAQISEKISELTVLAFFA